MSKGNEILSADPRFTKLIINALLSEYSPAVSFTEATDFKTTVELIEEIEGFASTDRETVTDAMIEAGFIIRTIDGAPFWLLRKLPE